MKLEYGKRYVTRDLNITDPLEYSRMHHFPFKAMVTDYRGYYTWDVNGNQCIDPSDKSPLDIVSEYLKPVCETPTPTPTPTPRKLVWVPGRTYKMRNGGLVFVTLVNEGQTYPITGFRLYPGEDSELFPNTWTIHGKRHVGAVESSFDIVDYAYEVGDTDD